MPSDLAATRRDYEEVLRSLGRLFDEQRLEDVLLLERGSGFLATGLRRQGAPDGNEAPEHRYQYIESTYSDDEVTAASTEGAKRRGSRHRADRNEAGLRLIGRHINETGGSAVLVVDRGDEFLVRMLMAAEVDLPHRFAAITSAELERLRELAIAGRRERPGVATS